jgi:hypothetical protein
MNDRNDQANDEKPQGQGDPLCTCITDEFASLPPERRPRPRNTMGGLRKVTCPGCNLVYWTNRQIDLCIDCEKKGVKIPDPREKSGG